MEDHTVTSTYRLHRGYKVGLDLGSLATRSTSSSRFRASSRAGLARFHIRRGVW